MYLSYVGGPRLEMKRADLIVSPIMHPVFFVPTMTDVTDVENVKPVENPPTKTVDTTEAVKSAAPVKSVEVSRGSALQFHAPGGEPQHDHPRLLEEQP